MSTKPTAPKIEIPIADMARIGKREMQLIEKDADKGKTQNLSGSKTSSYKSQQYKKYKQNYMKRFTNRTGSVGTKIKAYTGQSVVSNQTAFKNYKLTGKMFKGLHIQNPKVNEVTVSYMSKDTGKVMGASEAGDELVGLNNKNIGIIKDMIIKKMNKEVTQWAREDLNLVIG